MIETSSLALSSIERIAKSAVHERAIVFFLFFARFEYALKKAGFVEKRSNRAPKHCTLHGGNARVRQSKDAETDWTKYAAHCSAFLANNKQPRFQRAVEYLQKHPPKKQTLSGSRLHWTDDSFTGAWDMDRVLTLVRRVRNNLLHGGKRLVGHPEEAISRDKKLLNAGLTVMEACLDWDTNLKSAFLEELDLS